MMSSRVNKAADSVAIQMSHRYQEDAHRLRPLISDTKTASFPAVGLSQECRDITV